MSNIVKTTERYAVSLRNTYDEIIILNNKIKTLNPETVRKNFDMYWNIINNKSEEINPILENINGSIKNLEDCKDLLLNIKDATDKAKQIMNSLKVGTLQGLTRDYIKEQNIIPSVNDETAQNVLAQSYNELEDLNRNKTGGRKSKKRMKRGKCRKSRKSRKSRNARLHSLRV